MKHLGLHTLLAEKSEVLKVTSLYGRSVTSQNGKWYLISDIWNIYSTVYQFEHLKMFPFWYSKKIIRAYISEYIFSTTERCSYWSCPVGIIIWKLQQCKINGIRLILSENTFADKDEDKKTKKRQKQRLKKSQPVLYFWGYQIWY